MSSNNKPTPETLAGEPASQLRLVSKTTAAAVDEDTFAPRNETPPPPENPVYNKIRERLLSAEPERWRRVGEDLNPKIRHPRSMERWEQGFMLDVKDGVLLLRSSQPVRSEFFGGGYTLTPTVPPEHSIELREKGWNSRELADPYFRTVNRKDRKMQTLLQGRRAEMLFREIRSILDNYRASRRNDFENACTELMNGLVDKVAATKFESWVRTDLEADGVRFSCVIDGFSVESARVLIDKRIGFQLRIERSDLSKNVTTRLAEQVFNAIEDLGQTAKLEILDKVLEDIVDL